MYTMTGSDTCKRDKLRQAKQKISWMGEKCFVLAKCVQFEDVQGSTAYAVELVNSKRPWLNLTVHI